jgi:pyruvate,orthophosphate dikinase
MFLEGGRLQTFQAALFGDNAETRNAALEKLRGFQQADFAALFRAAHGKPVTVRLLDAPVDEFASVGECSEVNPMLGFRGIRFALARPEVYRTQVQALLDAAKAVRRDGFAACVRVLIPFVSTPDELRVLLFGRNTPESPEPALVPLLERLEKATGACPLGVMVELPQAALYAGELASLASFFAFGTNDLTQTTVGLSRDDYAEFSGVYDRLDINLDGKGSLPNAVERLVRLAAEEGRLVRPDLGLGICGEAGATSEGCAFAVNAGLDYVSCAPRLVPQAVLNAARTLAAIFP